ncbi:MAG TPA: hypothetical protein VFD84_17505 [Candidatus Binatia bacterium]|nr:hypothetical protein [Candidatus Binatia bacterium]
MLPRLPLQALRARRVALVPEILPPASDGPEPALIPFALGLPPPRDRGGVAEYAAPGGVAVGCLLDVYG